MFTFTLYTAAAHSAKCATCACACACVHSKQQLNSAECAESEKQMAKVLQCSKHTYTRTFALLQAAAANCESSVVWELRSAFDIADEVQVKVDMQGMLQCLTTTQFEMESKHCATVAQWNNAHAWCDTISKYFTLGE